MTEYEGNRPLQRLDEVGITWDGSRVLYSGYGGSRLFYSPYVKSNPELKVFDVVTRKEIAKRTFKELRAACEHDDRFHHITPLPSSTDLVAEYCWTIYLIDGNTLAVKASTRAVDVHSIAAVPESKRIIVVRHGNSPGITVHNSETLAVEGDWPDQEARSAISSRDGRFLVVLPEVAPAAGAPAGSCTLLVRALPKGAETREIPLGECTDALRVFSAGKGPTIATVDRIPKSRDVVITLWDVGSGAKANQVELQDSANVEVSKYSSGVVISSDYRFVIGNQVDSPHAFVFWDPNDGKRLQGFAPQKPPRLPRGHTSFFPLRTHLQLSGSGTRLLVETSGMGVGGVFGVVSIKP